MRPARLLLLALLTVGCGASGTSPFNLSWRFADGRTCTDAGVATVLVRDGATLVGHFECTAGFAPATVPISGAHNGSTLRLEGDSPPGAPLYAGEVEVTLAPTPATVALYPQASR